MLEFKKIGLEDQELLTEKLKALNCKLLNYDFVVMFIYRDLIHFEYALYKDWLIVKTFLQGEERFLFPVGRGDLEEVFQIIKDYSFQRQGNCHFFQFCDVNAKPILNWAKKIEESEKIQYNFYEVRGDFEYIYKTDDLINLEGHDLKPKRNHVNRFLKDNPNWTVENITARNIEEVVEFSKEWDIALEIEATSRLNWENIALDETLKHYFQLGLEGILLRVNGKIVAFSLGCPLCDDTYLTLFEKASREVQGSYAMINKEFARVVASDYIYINRAEDCGVEGLRKAKLSYNPDFLQKVYHLDISPKS